MVRKKDIHNAGNLSSSNTHLILNKVRKRGNMTPGSGGGVDAVRGVEALWDEFFVHAADSRNTWPTATIYSRDLMIPWEVCRRCNESNVSLFVCDQCVCVPELEITKCQKAKYLEIEIDSFVSWDGNRWTTVLLSMAVCVCLCLCVCFWYSFCSTGGLMGFRCVLLSHWANVNTVTIVCVLTYMRVCVRVWIKTVYTLPVPNLYITDVSMRFWSELFSFSAQLFSSVSPL